MGNHPPILAGLTSGHRWPNTTKNGI